MQLSTRHLEETKRQQPLAQAKEGKTAEKEEATNEVSLYERKPRTHDLRFLDPRFGGCMHVNIDKIYIHTITIIVDIGVWATH